MRRVRLPEDANVFLQAWNWIHERPWFFPSTGGKLDAEQYLRRAERIIQVDFAVWSGDELQTLITTEADAPGKFNFHITSKHKASPRLVIEAVYTVGWHLFDKVRAKQIYTYVPSFHHGSRRVAEACGLSFVWRTLDPEHTFHGKPLAWLIYGMNRAQFLEQHYGRGRNQTGR